jgi:hypothetical protein
MIMLRCSISAMRWAPGVSRYRVLLAWLGSGPTPRSSGRPRFDHPRQERDSPPLGLRVGCRQLPRTALWRVLDDRGTLIVAVGAGFAGRLRGWDVTMVMVRSYVWAGQSRHVRASAAQSRPTRSGCTAAIDVTPFVVAPGSPAECRQVFVEAEFEGECAAIRAGWADNEAPANWLRP